MFANGSCPKLSKHADQDIPLQDKGLQKITTHFLILHPHFLSLHSRVRAKTSSRSTSGPLSGCVERVPGVGMGVAHGLHTPPGSLSPGKQIVAIPGESGVGPVGFEPTTYGLKVRSSTIELEAHGSVRNREIMVAPQLPRQGPTSACCDERQ